MTNGTYSDPNDDDFYSPADKELYARRQKLRESGVIGRIAYNISGFFRSIFGKMPRGRNMNWRW